MSEVASPAIPSAEAVTVAVPVVVGVNETAATPFVGVAVALGLKVPLTPVTEKVTRFEALVTGFPN